MAKKLTKTGITTGNTVKAFHVTQSVDAFTGTDAYDISLSGSLHITGSVFVDSGAIPTTISASSRIYASSFIGTNVSTTTLENQSGNVITIGDSLHLSATTSHITASGNISSSGDIFFNPSNALTGTSVLTINPTTGQIFRTGSYGSSGGGGGGSTFPFTGSAAISGTLSLDGPAGHITSSGNISASNIIASKFLELPFSNQIDEGGIYFTNRTLVPGDEIPSIRGNAGAQGVGYLALGHSDSDTIKIKDSGRHDSVRVEGGMIVTSHITSSANISASNDIFANKYLLQGNDFATIATINGVANTISVGDSTTPNQLHFAGTNIFTSTNITSSANISASGDITAGNIFLPGNGVISFDNSLDGSDQKITGVDNQIVIDGDDLIVFKADSGGYEFRDTSNVATVHITTAGAITASGHISSSGGFIGEVTNVYRPITTLSTNPFTASDATAGAYYRTGGNITCSIFTAASVNCTTGVEFEFFQTSSEGYLCFTTASGVTLNSKSGNTKLAGQFSAATLKKIGTNEWDLIGDLG